MKKFEYKSYEYFEAIDGALYARNPEDPQYPLNVGYYLIAKKFKPGESAAEYWRQVVVASSAWEDTYPWHSEASSRWTIAETELARMEATERFAALPDVDWDKEILDYRDEKVQELSDKVTDGYDRFMEDQ